MPLLGFETTTSAFGILAPEASRTDPVMAPSPAAVWASAAIVENTKNTPIRKTLRTIFSLALRKLAIDCFVVYMRFSILFAKIPLLLI